MNEIELLRLELELAELTAANLRMRIEIIKRNLECDNSIPEFLKEQGA